MKRLLAVCIAVLAMAPVPLIMAQAASARVVVGPGPFHADPGIGPPLGYYEQIAANCENRAYRVSEPTPCANAESIVLNEDVIDMPGDLFKCLVAAAITTAGVVTGGVLNKGASNEIANNSIGAAGAACIGVVVGDS